MCILLGKIYLKEFPVSSDWDDDGKKDQIKCEDKDKGNDQKISKTTPDSLQ